MEKIIDQSCARQLRSEQIPSVPDARFALKGTSAVYVPDRVFDAEHIRLEISVDFSKESITAVCETQIKAIVGGPKEIVFDAVNFKIHRVSWNGKKAVHTYKDRKLTIRLPRSMKDGEIGKASIYYKIQKPKLGLYFIKPSRSYPKNPTQLWTQGEDEYARYWFPCFDSPIDRTTTEVIATVPKGFIAVSNGKLLKTKHGNRTSTFHYRQDIPHSTYLVTLTAGRFSEIKEMWRGKPVLYYCEKGREAEAKRAFGKTPKMLEFFSKKIGTEYPYDKYAQIAAADFIYGGMENTSATTQTDVALLDERAVIDYSSDELVAHELAHQWFGDLLTCKDWSHAWLNESFATYFDPLFKRFDKGEAEFQYAIFQNAEEYLHEDKMRYRRPITTNIFRRPSDLFDKHLYEKGSVVLHMLHQELGDKLFWRAIKLYVRQNREKVVETIDLIQAVEEATGKGIRRFFDQWVFGSGHPEYQVRAWYDRRRKELVVRTVQTNALGTNPVFHAKIEIAAETKAQEFRFPVVLNKKSHLFRFRIGNEPLRVSFDANHVLLKKVDFPKNEAWWIRQLQKDKHVVGRIEAAHALGKNKTTKALVALRTALLKDSFWGVRSEVAGALGQVRTEEAGQVLLHCLDVVDHPKVRRSIYLALRSYPRRDFALDIEKRLKKEKSYFAEAAAIITLGKMRHPKLKNILDEIMKKPSWNEVLRSAAMESMAASEDPQYLDQIIRTTHWGVPHRLRMAAIRALISYGTGDDRIQDKLIQLTRDTFLLVRIAAVRGLHLLGDERAVPALEKLTKGDLDGRLMRTTEEAIEKIKKNFD